MTPSSLAIKLFVDWDCQDWAGTHDFSQSIDDISADVTKIRVTRSFDRQNLTYPAATLEMTLKNENGQYYPTNQASPLYPKIRIWLPVKLQIAWTHIVEGSPQTDTYDRFYGYLNRILAYPKKKGYVYFYATDGTDLLAKTIIVQDMDRPTQKTDGAAINDILDAAGWNADRRNIDLTGGTITHWPLTFEYTEPT